MTQGDSNMSWESLSNS